MLLANEMAEGEGFGHVPRPRHNIFENKFSRVDSLATRHWRLSPYRVRIHFRQKKYPRQARAYFLAVCIGRSSNVFRTKSAGF